MIEINREKPYFVGNWKMNKTFNELETFITNVQLKDCHQWIAPQILHLHAFREMTKNRSPIKVGSQNHCHEKAGAFTGEVSISELLELGIDFTIVGHSERRQLFGESNSLIAKKVQLSLLNKLPTILCIGETLEQREAGSTFNILDDQLETATMELSNEQYKRLVIAYEPVWAIGTGKTATPAQAQEAHQFIRSKLNSSFGELADRTPILYGGSVKPQNVKELMAKSDIDGALIGGASLEQEEYNALCQSGI